MKKIRLYHNNSIIFSQNLNFCNNNSICENTENYESCPLDCPLNIVDNLCLPFDDGICDPDCAADVDVNCGLDLINLTTAKHNGTDVIYKFIIKNFYNQTLTNVAFTFNTGETKKNSTINITLTSLENIFVYFNYKYNSTGNKLVNATIRSGYLIDSERFNITI